MHAHIWQKKLNILTYYVFLQFQKHELSSSYISRCCFCGGNACSRCLSTGQQYWATVLGNTVSQMPWYCYWARQGIPQITCSLSLASAGSYTGNLLKGLSSETEAPNTHGKKWVREPDLAV